MPEVGEKAPPFKLVNQDMKPVSLGDYVGRKVVLAFYPGAFTGGCRKELRPISRSLIRTRKKP